MDTTPNHQLPTSAEWRFDSIASRDPARAKTLDSAPSPCEIISALASCLNRSISENELRIGVEGALSNPQHRRAVLQFHVGVSLYDWFFNGRTGYRAHYRAHYELGLSFNSSVIDELRTCLQAQVKGNVAARDLGSDFRDHGPMEISKDFLVASLDSRLSKVWVCTRRMNGDGTIDELPYGIDGEIELDTDDRWTALYRDDASAWLDVKGAFYCDGRLYQPRDSVQRAKLLQDRGSA